MFVFHNLYHLFKHPLKKGRVKLQVLRSFTIKDDGDHDAGDVIFAEVG
jgi:hypothetical protein